LLDQLLLCLSFTESFICSFNQLDLPEYPSKQHLEKRLLLAIHEANEGFGFGWQVFCFFFGRGWVTKSNCITF